MDHNEIIQKTIIFVKQQLEGAEGGHDWWHIQRVHNTAKQIAEEETADLLVVELGALLHDIADPKFHNGNDDLGPEIAQNFLHSLKIPQEKIDHVVNIIRHISYSSGYQDQQFNSLELRVTQDADRLDAIGAIGIARAFNYGGFKGREIYNPTIPPQEYTSKEGYRSSISPTINHFYEKLLLLKAKMNTSTGKRKAEERHAFMVSYLDQFHLEWGE
jgi:uncharacterized protein